MKCKKEECSRETENKLCSLHNLTEKIKENKNIIRELENKANLSRYGKCRVFTCKKPSKYGKKTLCNSHYHRLMYNTNPKFREKVRLTSRENYRKNPAKIRAYQKKYINANPALHSHYAIKSQIKRGDWGSYETPKGNTTDPLSHRKGVYRRMMIRLMLPYIQKAEERTEAKKKHLEKMLDGRTK